jgi:NADPH:quinone reductase-like Zn-dependent oxidoreductase
MKALVFHGKGDLRLQDVPEPECGPGKVKVKPVWCGICGTGAFCFVFPFMLGVGALRALSFMEDSGSVEGL